MRTLKIRLIDGNKEINTSKFSQGNRLYSSKINAENYKEIALILKDLKNIGLPIDKAIKEFNLIKSDWDASLGI